MIATPKTNSEWIEWGKRDPLFGVASSPGKEIGGSHPWTEVDFYSLGENDWRVFEDHWSRYGLKRDTFLEIGCGAGRITKQLAKTFRKGHAFDVSPDMIEIAKRNVVGDVEWHLTGGQELPIEDNSTDAAFSCHVFQHFADLKVSESYFREIFRVLRPGGTMMVHLPIYVMPTHASDKVASLLEFLYRRFGLPAQNAIIAYKRFRMHFGRRPPMNGLDYQASQLWKTLSSLSFENIEFDFFTTSVNSEFLFSFAMATKPTVR